MPNRDLTMDDVRAVMALQAERPEHETYKAVERLAGETCSFRLLTILKYVEKDAVVERVSSSDEKAYPIGGRKPLDKITMSHGVTGQGNGPEADPAHSPGDLTDGKRASRNPDGVMFYKIWNGRSKPKMPALKMDISRQDVWTVITYIKTLRR